MLYHVSIHRPKPEHERDVIDSMHRFGAAARTQDGLLEVHTLKDRRSDALIGLAVWALVVAAAFAGPSDIPANIAPWAFYIQFWHHIEHGLLQAQVIFGRNLFGSPVPISIAQLVIPRLELHLIYNTIVFVPMIIAMYKHLVPSDAERAMMRCTCAVPSGAAMA